MRTIKQWLKAKVLLSPITAYLICLPQPRRTSTIIYANSCNNWIDCHRQAHKWKLATNKMGDTTADNCLGLWRSCSWPFGVCGCRLLLSWDSRGRCSCSAVSVVITIASLAWMAMNLAWIAVGLMSSKRETRYASAASCSTPINARWEGLLLIVVDDIEHACSLCTCSLWAARSLVFRKCSGSRSAQCTNCCWRILWHTHQPTTAHETQVMKMHPS